MENIKNRTISIFNIIENKEIVFLFLIIASFIEPAGLRNASIFPMFYDLGRILGFFFIIWKLYTKEYKLSRVLYLLIGYQFITLMIKFINVFSLSRSDILIALWTIVPLIVLDNEIKINSKRIISIVYWIFLVLLGLNLIFMLLNVQFPSSAYHSFHLLGIRTSFTSYGLIALISSAIFSLQRENKVISKYSAGMFAIVLTQLMFQWVATGILAVATFGVVLYVLTKIERIREKGTYLNFVVLGLVINFSVIILRIQNLFSFIIVDILDKSLTLTDRIYIWDIAIETIGNSPLIGFGVNTQMARVVGFGPSPMFAHSQLLQMGLDSGLLGILLFISLFFYVSKNIRRNQNTLMSTILSVGTFTILIVMIMEVLFYSYFMWFIFIYIYNQKHLNSNVEDRLEY
ncbi:O-antigen ligase family protein [Alkalibacterium putridalgicola]|uniref:O-antigen ligase family protein n=1 Tax=Alkalibacterium putridalgicola TaxID=426703 RepID=UPI0034CD866A